METSPDVSMSGCLHIVLSDGMLYIHKMETQVAYTTAMELEPLRNTLV